MSEYVSIKYAYLSNNFDDTKLNKPIKA
jgi:hypothetical protein